MLLALFPQLEKAKFTGIARAFFRSSYYPFLIAALMALSEIFALELAVYYLYLAIGICCILFCEDALGLLPIICCCYMTFAYENNPHVPTPGHEKLFSDPVNLLQLFCIIAVAAILLIGRLVSYVVEHPTRRVPSLTAGFLVLGAAYLLSGVGYDGYDAWKAIVYAIVQILSLSLFYFYFYYTVDWDTVKKSYIFTVFIAIGVGLLAEIGAMYSHSGVFVLKEDGSWFVNRGALGTGWGVYNNVGCVMAMCIPAPFYFSVKNERWGWAFSLLGCLFMLGVAFTQSRGSILFGAVVFAACVVSVLVMAKGKNRIFSAIVFGAMAIALIGAVVLFYTEMGGIFSAIKETFVKIFLQADLNEISSDRIRQYRESLKIFAAHPFLGVGFHNLGDGGFAFLQGSLLIPPRVHNTFLNLLASGGIVALCAYLFHRTQTAILWLKKPNFEKTMAAFIIGAMLLTAMLDCHFFNYGPGLLYGCILAYGECCANGPIDRSGRPASARRA